MSWLARLLSSSTTSHFAPASSGEPSAFSEVQQYVQNTETYISHEEFGAHPKIVEEEEDIRYPYQRVSPEFMTKQRSTLIFCAEAHESHSVCSQED